VESLIENYEKPKDNRDLNWTNPVYKAEVCSYTNIFGDKFEFYEAK
jgi:hypothetical protein